MESQQSILKFFGYQLQNLDLLRYLQPDGVIIDLLWSGFYPSDNGRCVLANLAQQCAS